MNFANLHWWPRTLFARLTLILLIGLILAHALTFGLIVFERTQAANSMMLGYMEQDVASSVALLDHLPAAERPIWVPRLKRETYGYILGPGTAGAPPDEMTAMRLAVINEAIGSHYQLTANLLPDKFRHLQVHLQLSDGSPLTIDIRPKSNPVSIWLLMVLFVQIVLLAFFSWACVRQATLPLSQLASAANSLGPDLAPIRLSEQGPTEVAQAASAFNAMQDRIARYMTERMQILAAISHDLQTPITRMRLRLDLMEDCTLRGTLEKNLLEMEILVREGVSYARTLQGTTEQPLSLNPDALLDSLKCDYLDAGAAVTLHGQIGVTLVTRPIALRRILTNLIDNALAYSGNAEISVGAPRNGMATIAILDTGPGIPEDLLITVFQPFYRLESSRSRKTGGTGLGLAIAHQLALAMNATLTLHNRAEGGLEARLTIPAITLS